jgi:uncharacterized protein
MNNWSYNPIGFIALMFVAFAIYCWIQLPGKDAQLLVAAGRNNTNVIQALIRKGANPNTRAKQDDATPLMIAGGHGNQEAVELLLKLGARKDLKDDVGRTARDYAQERGQTNLARLLR